ncbi:hypothetical protein HYQ45_008481 [Verticillium longisporum]|uniref:Uncharacterized protein n=1 Tax=Verticillium longisporum TaxID=100787 RepID=A0A8I2ZLJ0_VERLO|nr:hypothetical protein HYQ45_008481 [Verticillium longisporum]
MIGGGRKNVFYDLVELEGGSFRQSVKAEVLQCFDTLRADDRSSQYIRDVLTVDFKRAGQDIRSSARQMSTGRRILRFTVESKFS